MTSGLAALRQRGWRLVVLSNGRADNQLGKLRRTGLLELLWISHGRPWPDHLPRPTVTVSTPAEALHHLLVTVIP